MEYQAKVTLTDDELARMTRFADRIHDANRKRRRRHLQGWKPKGREAVLARENGYCAELAFAKFLGVEWREFGVEADHFRRRPDVAGYDVKSTDLFTGRLIVTPHDDPDAKCVLVVCNPPDFYVVGWFRAGDAHRSEWYDEYRKDGGAWYVPRSQMKPVPPYVPVEHVEHGSSDDVLAVVDDEYDRLVAERLGDTGPVARGDWRAVLRAQGIEPPKGVDDVEPRT
jgi:hypothetical protein